MIDDGQLLINISGYNHSCMEFQVVPEKVLMWLSHVES